MASRKDDLKSAYKTLENSGLYRSPYLRRNEYYLPSKVIALLDEAKASARTNIAFDGGKSLRVEKRKVSPKLWMAHVIITSEGLTKAKKAREILNELVKRYPKTFYKK